MPGPGRLSGRRVAAGQSEIVPRAAAWSNECVSRFRGEFVGAVIVGGPENPLSLGTIPVGGFLGSIVGEMGAEAVADQIEEDNKEC